jgi:hypothetical protein
MITEADHVSIPLIDNRIDFCRRLAKQRQGNAERLGLAGHNNAPNDPVAALGLHDAGVLGEAASMIYLSPCNWNLMDMLRADINDLIDVKTRSETWMDLPIQHNDDKDWIYVLACRQHFPRIMLIGWCWGHEGKIEDNWGSVPTLIPRPAYWVKQSDPVMRPMRELRIYLHGKGAR